MVVVDLGWWWCWWGEGWEGWLVQGESEFRLPGAEVGGASARLVSDKQESCESLDTLSFGLSHKKKQLVPLQVCKQSVSLCIFSHPQHVPPQNSKPEVLADLSSFLPVCPILLLPCFRAVSASPPLARPSISL